MDTQNTILEDKKENDKKFESTLFYSLIGIVSSLAWFVIFYWSLRINSSITTLVQKTSVSPLYIWLYAVLTFGAIILFGINASLVTYQWRKFGRPKINPLTYKLGEGIKGETSIALGSIVGIAASACPTCGSILLSSIGIAGGLAAFPLQGLELKGLSFILMAIPVWLAVRKIKKNKVGCENGTCPAPKDDSLKAEEKQWIAILFFSLILLSLIGWNMFSKEPFMEKQVSATTLSNPLVDEISAKIIPAKGYQSKIVLGDAVIKLIAGEAIDPVKVNALYAERGGFPSELKTILTKADNHPILLTQGNAGHYLNLLWALGLSNHMDVNQESPVNGKDLFNFAATGGWNLGKAENGGTYFNTLAIVPLTADQENLVKRIAENTYRPCCNNSTFFQDCNHGSALLGLLELGAAQGLTEDELYSEALHFNSFWFSQTYIEMAIYFKEVKNIDWENVDPKVALGKDYSSGSGWFNNIHKKLTDLNLLPKTAGSGSGCGA